MNEIQLESLEKKPMLHSNVSRNKRENRRAMLAAPIIILMLPFAVGSFWYGIGVMSPAISVMPASGLDVATGQYTMFYLYTGHVPGVDDWIIMLGGLGIGYAMAAVIGAALVALGYWGWAEVAAICISSGAGIVILTAILGF